MPLRGSSKVDLAPRVLESGLKTERGSSLSHRTHTLFETQLPNSSFYLYLRFARGDSARIYLPGRRLS
jgi:hypothetical protein